MGKPSLIAVLAEDERHQSFVRRYLYRLGYSARDIRFEALPGNRGSGEKWVRDRYSTAVGAYRERSARAETRLVVVIDADRNEVSWRVQQLGESLTASGMNARSGDEAIVHLIPKRNIETWILCLNGTPVDEDSDYLREPDIDAQIKTAALTLYEWSRPNQTPPEYCIPSIRTAIPEIKRLE